MEDPMLDFFWPFLTFFGCFGAAPPVGGKQITV